jgi:hypothetical protein
VPHHRRQSYLRNLRRILSNSAPRLKSIVLVSLLVLNAEVKKLLILLNSCVLVMKLKLSSLLVIAVVILSKRDNILFSLFFVVIINASLKEYIYYNSENNKYS